MFEGFKKNIDTLTEEQAQTIEKKCVAIVGLGGLGGRNAEIMCRLGVGKLILIDFDEFSISNLNRQMFSNCNTIGEKKAEVAKRELLQINDNIVIEIKIEKLDSQNACELLDSADLVIDALDNIDSRLQLELATSAMNIPLVHGGVGGFCGEVAVVFPNEKILQKLYQNKKQNKNSTVLACTCAVTSGIQSNIATQILIDKFDAKSENLFLIDLLNMNFEKVKI